MNSQNTKLKLSEIVCRDPGLCEIYNKLGPVILVPILPGWAAIDPSVTIAGTFAESQGARYSTALTRMNVGMLSGSVSGNLYAMALSEKEIGSSPWLRTEMLKTLTVQVNSTLFGFYELQGDGGANIQVGTKALLNDGAIIPLVNRGCGQSACQWLNSKPLLAIRLRRDTLIRHKKATPTARQTAEAELRYDEERLRARVMFNALAVTQTGAMEHPAINQALRLLTQGGRKPMIGR